MSKRMDTKLKKQNNTRANIATLISIISLLLTGYSLWHSANNDSKLTELESNKLNLSQYEIVYKDSIEKKEKYLEKLGEDISNIEILFEKVKFTNDETLQSLSKEMTVDELKNINTERTNIFNNIWRYLNNENTKYYELNNLINNYLKSIEDSTNKISNYTASPNQENRGFLPQTGGLPDLEKIFTEYKNEEQMRIKEAKEKLIKP